MTVYIENSREAHQKIQHRIIVRSSNSTSVYVLQELKADSKHLYTNVHTSIIHNNYNMETIEVSTDEWID